ncbi:SRPBCC domain-containing protein [Brevibacillus borstelensis]|uniref:SRPBCC domain-containing protein n=1 Tax=Brevibacillus borstelensis TaxID=45462 RepID=UPI0030C2DD24
MLALIQKAEDGYEACYKKHLKHSIDKVWATLTENERLAKWFPELRADDLREGGDMAFHMPDGTVEKLPITALKTHSVLEYAWWGDSVRFELYPESESNDSGCLLVLKRKIIALTDHTPKDLAGWHVCLEVIEALLDGRTIESRESEWKKWYERYIQAVENIKSSQE